MRKSFFEVQAQQLTSLGTGEEGYQSEFKGTGPCHKPRTPVDPEIASHIWHAESGNDMNFLCGKPTTTTAVDMFAFNGGRVSCNACQRILNERRQGHLVKNYSSELAVA